MRGKRIETNRECCKRRLTTLSVCFGSKLVERCVENTEIFLTRWEDFRGGFESLTQEEKDLPKDDSRSAYFFCETESEVLAV